MEDDIFVTPDSVLSEKNEPDYEVAKNIVDGITLNVGDGDKITMGLPNFSEEVEGVLTDSGTIVYMGDNEEYSISAQILEDSVRSLIVINDSTAGEEFSFDFELPEGYNFELSSNDDSYTHIENFIVITNNNDEVIGEVFLLQ